MQRRTFLLSSAAAVATAATTAVGGGWLYEQRPKPKRAGASTYNPNTATQRTYGDLTLDRVKASDSAPNVLFIALDDCNDWVGFLANHPGTKTPNLDALAASSLSFTDAYCVAPMCNPARSGVMFGQQPFTSGVYDHSQASFDMYDAMAKVTPSLVDDLWAAGYTTIGAGKVFNDPEADRWGTYRRTDFYADFFDRRQPAWAGRFDPNWLSPYDGQPEGDGSQMTIDMMDFGPSGRDRDGDPEGQASAWVAERLRDPYDAPFLLAYGAICTHLPWRVPQAFFDMHPLDEIVLPAYTPNDVNDLSKYARTKIVDTNHIFARLVADHLWERAVQAYQAAISYADDCIGRVLDQLHSGPHADNTIVVLWSDHGFHMGEKMHIEKFSLWEHGTRIPFLLHVPGSASNGQTFDRPVSAIDIGPTVAELAGARIHASDHAGRSLLPVVAHPETADDRPPLMTWGVANQALRRDNWRYIRYVTGDVELYDHSNDPEELTNLADDPSTQDVQRQLKRYLPPVPRDADTRPNAVVNDRGD